MIEGQSAGDAAKGLAQQRNIKPDAAEPGSQVGQQRAARAAYLLVVEHRAA